MKDSSTLRRVSTALVLLVAFLLQGTWALAGTTGGLGGNVTDESGKPVANVKITASSPSQTTSAQTDAAGHFVFLALSPDTYTVTAQKDGYTPASLAGATVFADNVQNYQIQLHTALKTIAQVTSRASGNLVKAGTTADIYSVNSATQQAVSALGGGGNLNSAYSAVYSVPGVNSAINNYGFGQTFYIRGSEYNQVGYEFDGVPVNRAFDNYNGSSLSSLGQQELQVYTGAAPAGSATATVGGYINQVIKTGTYPGSGSADFGLGAPTFYHSAKVEAGGAAPNRMFSYYAAVSGYNQQFRQINQQNGGNIPLSSGLYGAASVAMTPFYANGTPACNVDGSNPNANSTNANLAAINCTAFSAPGGFDYQDGNADREAVLNFHFGIPHKNDGGKDDIQLLYTASTFHTDYAESINDLGGMAGLNSQFLGDFCGNSGYCTNGVPHYEDGYIFAPGTTFGQLASTATGVPYLFPSTGLNRQYRAPIPFDQRNTIFNDSNIIKGQYQKNFGSKAYARIYGYSLYSDWLQNGPTFGIFGYGIGGGWCCSGGVSRDYELSAHTRGGEFQFADQFDSKNLITLTGNYVTSSVVRFNNGTMSNSKTTSATNLTDGTNCFSYTTGAQASCLSSSTSGTYVDPTRSTYCATPGNACAPIPAGAQWEVTVPGERGTFNTVKPKFSSVALTDEFRPNDKLDLNLGVRFERFEYDLAQPGKDFPFWYNAAANSYCYNLTTLAPLVPALKVGQQPPATPSVISGPCPAGFAHPSATDPANTRGLVYSAGNGGVLAHDLVSPRIGLTYTLNPDTVLRASYGRYAEPVTTATTQYLDKSGKSSAAFNFTNFWQYGFTTPVHPLVPQVSNNVDFSIEKRLHGTDISFKLSPFYRYTTDQLNSISIGPNFVSSLNVGTQRSYGVEVALSKGDPTRNGLSGTIAYTYTNARIKFSNFSTGRNAVDNINDYINAYNGLTKNGGGSPCYAPGTGAADPACGVTSIANPYYNSAPQGLLDRNGWYETYANDFPSQPVALQEPVIAPNVFSGFVSYKHDRLTITPTFQLNQGNTYGSPLSVYGYDPRTCAANQAASGIAGGAPNAADFTTCGASIATGDGLLAIPNPQTGHFDGMGEYRNPWQFNLGTSIGYDISNRVHANVVLANIVNRCFGGSSTPWSKQFAPSNIICGYSPNGSLYQSNFYNGSGPNDPVNGVALPSFEQQSYAPIPFQGSAGNTVLPFNVYMNVQIKL